MILRRRIATGDEQDAYTGWRKFYCYLQRPGAVKAIKRATHRRERREGRGDIEAQLRDYYDEKDAR